MAHKVIMTFKEAGKSPLKRNPLDQGEKKRLTGAALSLTKKIPGNVNLYFLKHGTKDYEVTVSIGSGQMTFEPKKGDCYRTIALQAIQAAQKSLGGKKKKKRFHQGTW